MKISEIISGMRNKNRELSMKIDDLEKLVESKAQAERDFNVAFSKKLLELKASGEAVTTSKALAMGDVKVADLRFKHAVADGVYDACKKRVRSLEIAIDSYRSLLSYEKAEFKNSSIGHGR